MRSFPWSRFLVVLPLLLPPAKGDHANQPFLPGSFQHSPLRPSITSGNPSPKGTWKLLACLCRLGLCAGCFQGTFRRLQGQWHCLDKPEVTSLSSFSQCQSCPGSEVPPKFAAQSLPVPSSLLRGAGRGDRVEWGGTVNQDRQEAQAERALWARQTACTGNHGPPHPPHPPEPRREEDHSLVPKQGQGPGVSLGQGRSQQPASPLSAPDPTWGGEEAKLAGMVLPL